MLLLTGLTTVSEGEEIPDIARGASHKSDQRHLEAMNTWTIE